MGLFTFSDTTIGDLSIRDGFVTACENSRGNAANAAIVHSDKEDVRFFDFPRQREIRKQTQSKQSEKGQLGKTNSCGIASGGEHGEDVLSYGLTDTAALKLSRHELFERI